MSPTTEPVETKPRVSRARPTRASDLVIGVYAGVVYLFFLALLGYAVGFFAGIGVPKTIDDGPSGSRPAAVFVDLLLLALFAAQHTVMARPWFKQRWTRVVPVAAERTSFVLGANLVLALLFWQWRPVDATVWRLRGPLAIPLWTGYLAGWALAVGSTFVISHSDLFGLRQAWRRVCRTGYRPPPFTERGPYRYIRHPLLAGFLLVFWSAPTMTAGHLLFATAATAYIVFGIACEERDSIRSLGGSYADYRARVPKLIPGRRRPNG